MFAPGRYWRGQLLSFNASVTNDDVCQAEVIIGGSMNKAELINAVSGATALTKAQAGKVIDAGLQAIQEALAKGDDVRILGFGSFSVNQRAAGEGRNPRTGEKVQIPARNVPSFKAGMAFKEAVNK
jgi:DNA-binding protein HU-beta